jgi:DNA-binding NtrC family response regulator
MDLATPRQPKPTVLFVDDEEMICHVMSALFPRHDIDVITANTVHEACVALREVNIDALVIDYRLALGESGVDVVEFVRKIRPELGSRILMISGDVSDGPYNTITGDLRLPFLPKPFDIGQLVLSVRQLLAQDLLPGRINGNTIAK